MLIPALLPHSCWRVGLSDSNLRGKIRLARRWVTDAERGTNRGTKQFPSKSSQKNADFVGSERGTRTPDPRIMIPVL